MRPARAAALGLLAGCLCLPASSLAGELTLQNQDGLPFPDRLSMNRIGAPQGLPVHDTATVRIQNTGTTALRVTGLSTTGAFALGRTITLPASIAAGGSLDVPVAYTATVPGSPDPARHDGALTILSDDADEPITTVQLAGLWMDAPGGANERTLAKIVTVFGYTTTIVGSSQSLQRQSRVEAVGDEVISSYWRRADESQPVTVRMIAAFHDEEPATTGWFVKGATTSTTLSVQAANERQMLFPRRTDLAAPAGGSFTPAPGQSFGLRMNDVWSDPARNLQPSNCTASACGHFMRFWPVEDRSGAVIPNRYLMAADVPGGNYDYQDYIYLVSNVVPEDQAPAETTGPYEFDGSTVAMEAENADEVVSRSGETWTAGATPAGGVGTVMTAGPDNGGQWTDIAAAPGAAPELRFRVDFPAAGTYRVSLRANMPNTNGNSAHVGLNGVIPLTSDFFGSSAFGTWQWLNASGGGPNPATISVPSAGVHTVNVYPREDGFSLDRVVISTAGSAAPTGTGPAESGRAGAAAGPYRSVNGAVTMEAENAAEVVDRSGTGWDAGLAPAGAVGGALTVPNAGVTWGNLTTVPTVSPEIRFQVNFDQPGTYRVWVRSNPLDTGGDSLHVGLNGAVTATSDAVNSTSYGNWVWAASSAGGPNPATVTVPSAGVHTVSIYGREDGMSVDRVHMSITGAAPTGSGPVESARG